MLPFLQDILLHQIFCADKTGTRNEIQFNQLFSQGCHSSLPLPST